MTLPSHPVLPRQAAVPVACLGALLLAALPAQAYIPEPETLIYGRILNRTGARQDQLITSGTLVWKIEKADGTSMTLNGEVGELAGGASYFIRVPHQALVLGQTQVARVLPLGVTKTKASHIDIKVGDKQARILSPGTSNLDLEETLRGSAHRLDLEISGPELDSDGDGLPDWWEDLHGLDKQDPADGLSDRDGDGRSNLTEYQGGTDPNGDSRKPKLLTTEVIAYGASKSVVLLETADSDSTPEQLIYTLNGVPANGRLFLRNPDTTLAPATTFTQADVLNGRLVFEHGQAEEAGVIDVSVRDEDPAHEAATGSVRVLLFNPAADLTGTDGAEKLRFRSLALTKAGTHLVADLSSTSGAHKLATASSKIAASAYPAHVAAYGEEKAHIFLGGPSVDELTGGPGADILAAGGADDLLAGGRGADTFVYTGATDGNDSIADFNAAEHDAIDLSAVLNGTSTNLPDYVRIESDGADSILGVSFTGAAAGYSDLRIRLKNLALQPSDVATLYYGGNLITGKAGLAPRISIAASATKASENGAVEGYFVLTREGSLAAPVTAQISFSGTARNGDDFMILGTSVVFPAGTASVKLPVVPYVDSIYEGDEVVAVTIAPSNAYLTGVSQAQLAIEDLKPQLWAEVVDSIASINDLSPASITIHRGGAIDRSVTVNLEYSGTATKGTDYVSPPATLSFAAWDTEKTVSITPKSTAVLSTVEGETVNLGIKTSTVYLSDASKSRVVIVPEKLTFDKWQASNSVLRNIGAMSSDPGGSGLNLLMRYGFSLDPENPYGDDKISRMPKLDMVDGHMLLRFRRKPGITDLDYTVQYSTDLKTWHSGSEYVENISQQQAPDDPGAVIYRAKAPVSATSTASMRVVLATEEAQ